MAKALHGIVALALAAAPAAALSDVVVRAGTIHTVDPALGTIEHGAILVRDGRVVEVGESVAVPPGAEVIDYGPDAVVVPGFVMASSAYALGRPSARTAEPGLSALDGFDFYGRYESALAAGVTSAYITPARARLIAGQGAVVKLGGTDPGRRVLAAPAVLHGSIAADARNTPGFWEPPVPPTVDTGLGYMKPQLPRSTMGAIVALDELLAGLGEPSEAYGPATRDLVALMERRTPWRMRAEKANEIRALLGFAARHELPLVIEGADDAAELADELAAAGVSVVYEVDFRPNSPGVDRGKSPEARWPDYTVPAALDAAGVPFAIGYMSGARDLLFGARLAMRGGLDPEAALHAITRAPAEILGAADRVGSLAPGKDADLAVFLGEPLEGGALVATWLDGGPAWSSAGEETARAVVVEVEELHVGDGEVLRPGAVLMQDGRIVEVGRRVSRPAGAKLVRGFAAMPGMIDALGFLGLEGTRSNARTDAKLSRIVGPGDDADRRVALAGVTTVVLSARGGSSSGIPMTAYKPAGRGERQVVADPTTLRVAWTDENRLKSGKDVRDILEKLVKYREKWDEYEAEFAAWKPSPPKPAKAEDDDDDEEGDEEKDDADDDKKKKKKKKDDDEPEADPVTGIWESTLVRPPRSDASPLRLQLWNDAGKVGGSLRCDALSDDLISLEGRFEDGELRVVGLGTQGWVELTGKPAEGELEAVLTVGGAELELEAKRTRADVPRANRPVAKPAEEEEEDRDKPRPPRLDEDLEPFRRAAEGEGTIVVAVNRDDEILACVEAFAGSGIEPVLYGADGIRFVASRVADRIAGVMLTHRVVEHDRDEGLVYRNRYAELQGAGIRIAFHSLAEEGAADLPLMASYAIANGLSGDGALRALTADAADMLHIGDRVGRLRAGLDADVLLLDGAPLDPATSVLRSWVNGEEVLRP